MNAIKNSGFAQNKGTQTVLEFYFFLTKICLVLAISLLRNSLFFFSTIPGDKKKQFREKDSLISQILPDLAVSVSHIVPSVSEDGYFPDR